ncbi:MAG: hydrogenase maturation protein HypF [Alphaproteobacteria bacterium]|nr:hydrogenase maturation protein HypF [Alphaproteobacteria bacterium]
MKNPAAAIIRLSRPLPPVLGAGAFLKNTLCLIQGNEAWISRDNGSLDNVEAIENYEQTAAEMLAAAKEKPVAVAHDLHPDFASTHFALSSGLRPIGIQHHHAHIAAIMAEHGISEPVLGLALDGFGLGLNNESWGGELLRVDASGFQRVGHLYPLPQPGGDIAARQPWRMGAAALWALGRGDEIAGRYAAFPNATVLASMLERGLNSPPTTSAGRLFDAACGLLGVKPVAAFEGEAPMALEAMVRETKTDSEGWMITQQYAQEQQDSPPLAGVVRGGGVPLDGDFLKQQGSARSFSPLPNPPLKGEGILPALTLDLRPLLARLIDCEAQEGAELFHGTLIAALTDWAEKAAEQTGIRSVALGGGCFFNKVLRDSLCQRMMAAKLTPLLPQKLSPGDPALSLGQAWAAAMMIETGEV